MDRDFVQRFESAWLNPSPQRLGELLHPDIVLYQPHLPPIRGRDQVFKENTKLFAWLPDLYSVVKSAGGEGELLFIEHELTLPLDDGTVRVPAVDRFKLAGGLALERIVYFDQVQLIAAVLRHPRLWPGYLRYRFAET